MTEGAQNQEKPTAREEKRQHLALDQTLVKEGPGLGGGYKANVWRNGPLRLYCSSIRPSTRGGFAAESIVSVKCRLPFTIKMAVDAHTDGKSESRLS